jgi:nitric oxide reductase NorD protein
VDARTRLIIVITDGRPMDSGYDPNTHYAHYDVRRACAENAEAGMHTFCIAMGDEDPPELDMMFPARRYMILPDVNELPHALANAYLRLTKD